MLPLTARDLAPDIERAGQVEPLGAGWLTVTVVIGVMAALIALGGMVLSFRAVSTEMIPAFGARWAWLVPIVVDMTVFVFSGVDLVLARLDMSHPLARWTVYGATGGTVWLNYSAGGSVAGRVAHVLMPAIWVVFVELMRHVVRRQANLATGIAPRADPGRALAALALADAQAVAAHGAVAGALLPARARAGEACAWARSPRRARNTGGCGATASAR